MINKIVFTVTPIYSIPPKSAAAVESWIYHVAKRLEIENRIVCIQNEDILIIQKSTRNVQLKE